MLDNFILNHLKIAMESTPSTTTVILLPEEALSPSLEIVTEVQVVHYLKERNDELAIEHIGDFL